MIFQVSITGDELQVLQDIAVSNSMTPEAYLNSMVNSHLRPRLRERIISEINDLSHEELKEAASVLKAYFIAKRRGEV
jgi:hypothetical protein